jgi:hypothetical protein
MRPLGVERLRGKADQRRDCYGFNDPGQEISDGSRSLHC